MYLIYVDAVLKNQTDAFNLFSLKMVCSTSTTDVLSIILELLEHLYSYAYCAPAIFLSIVRK